MKRLSAPILCLLAALAACSGGGAANESGNVANMTAQEGLDPNMMIGGDEISPIPEIQDDMVANQTEGMNEAASANRFNPPPVPIPAPPPQGR